MICVYIISQVCNVFTNAGVAFCVKRFFFFFVILKELFEVELFHVSLHSLMASSDSYQIDLTIFTLNPIFH